MTEDKQPKQITVADIKEISPLSEVYKLNKYDKYLTVVPMSNLSGGKELAYERAKKIAIVMHKLELKFVIMVVAGDMMEGVKFLEFKE